MSEYLGKLVQDGEVRFWSPSALEKGDAKSHGGCERKFFYRYVEGLKEPERKGREVGTKAHAELEHYLKTGEDVLGTVARKVRRFVPERDSPGAAPSLMIEHEIPAGALELGGRRVVGKADLVSLRGQWITPRGDLDGDPKNSAEVIDWKFVSNMSYAKSGVDLLTTPMVTYGRYIMSAFKRDWLRLSHVYGHLSKNEAPAKTTLLVRRVDIDRRWEQAEGLARTLVDVARAKTATEVTPNLRACDEYGGCAYYPICPRTRDARLNSIFSTTDRTPVEGQAPMSLLANMNLPPTAQTAPAAPTDPAAALAHLREQERQAAVASLPPAIVQNWACVQSAGMGTPPLGGIIARAISILSGVELKGDGYAGSGQIGSIGVINTPDLLQKLADELATHVPTVHPKPWVNVPSHGPPAVLPPDAPVSAPPPPIVTTGIGTSPVMAGSMGGPKGGGPPYEPPPPPPAHTGASEAPKRGRGRPRKVAGDLETAAAALTKAIIDVLMIAAQSGEE